jgi:hypothetical protein
LISALFCEITDGLTGSLFLVCAVVPFACLNESLLLVKFLQIKRFININYILSVTKILNESHGWTFVSFNFSALCLVFLNYFYALLVQIKILKTHLSYVKAWCERQLIHLSAILELLTSYIMYIIARAFGVDGFVAGCCS